ncbi:uncharacterized protein DS421_9g262040 [Arachis hypogaea]|nr:uncharacterized protein DS421_9g262040 [Arachis hypogaea]
MNTSNVMPSLATHLLFKSFSERVDEIDINVYRSLEKVKAEPSEGSSFFRDCLIEWRVALESKAIC